MLHDRHQLDVGVALLHHVGDELAGQLLPGDMRAVPAAPPGAGMHLVDRDRRLRRLALAAPRHPVGVAPGAGVRIGHHRGGARRRLGLQRHRVGLLRQRAVRAEHVILVHGARLDARDEQLPDAGLHALAHGMARGVPAVEAAHHRHAPRIGRPAGEAHAINAVDGHGLRAQAAAELAMVAFRDQVQVHLAQQQAEAVRILGLLHRGRPVDAHAVAGGLLAISPANRPGVCTGLQRAHGPCRSAVQHLHLLRPRQQAAAGW